MEAAALAPVARPRLDFARVLLALLAEVSALSLGPLRLLGVPGEPTVDAGARLREATGAGTVLGLADGYLGYVETPEAVAAERGEARRQYFGPSLLEQLSAGARAAAQAAGF